MQQHGRKLEPPDPVGKPVALRVSSAELSLPLSLDSGQAFRWQPLATGAWFGFLDGHPTWLRHENDTLQAWGWPAPPRAARLREYLDLERPLASILATFPTGRGPLAAAVVRCRGLRILRQPAWETLASFIAGSNKRIDQTRGAIERLCTAFGRPFDLPGGRGRAHAFPAAGPIADAGELALRRLGLGYRAPYLLATARAAASGTLDLNRPASLPYEEARAYLMQLPGVGPKVADCVLLFAYDRQEAFPIDVWIERVLCRHYFPRPAPKPRERRRFAQSRFGPYAGYAQQYLFHWARTGGLVQRAGRSPAAVAAGARAACTRRA